ncbi:MAG: hypothetical protein ACQES9_08115 [Myxococcota bacterium]
MKKNVKPPRQIIEGLPSWFNQSHLIAWLDLKSGLNSNWGQTYLVLNREILLCMWRNSFNDKWNYFQVNPSSLSKIILKNFEETINLKDLKGNSYSIQIYNLEKEYFQDFSKKLNDILPALSHQSSAQENSTEETDFHVETSKSTSKNITNYSSTTTSTPPPKNIDELIKILQKRDLPQNSTDKNKFYEEILDYINEIELSDNQDNLPGQNEIIPNDNDIFEKFGSFFQQILYSSAEEFSSEQSQPAKSDKIEKFRKILLAKLEKIKNLKPDKTSSKTDSSPALSPLKQQEFDNYISSGDMLLQTIKKPARAIKAYEMAYKIKNDDPNLLKKLADAHLANNNKKAAKHYLDKLKLL